MSAASKFESVAGVIANTDACYCHRWSSLIREAMKLPKRYPLLLSVISSCEESPDSFPADDVTHEADYTFYYFTEVSYVRRLWSSHLRGPAARISEQLAASTRIASVIRQTVSLMHDER